MRSARKLVAAAMNWLGSPTWRERPIGPVYRALVLGVNALAILAVLGTAAADDRDIARARAEERLLARLTDRFAQEGPQPVLAAFDSLKGKELTPRLYNLHGLALAEVGRHREAIAVYEQGLMGTLSLYELHQNLARSLQVVGMTGRALYEFQEAARLGPGFFEPQLALGRALLDFNRFDQAQHQLEVAAQLDPEDPRLLEAWALWADAASPAEALERWQRLEARAPSPDTARRLGQLSGDPVESAGWYDRCAQRDSSQADCLAAAGTQWLRRGDAERAAQRLGLALAAGDSRGETVHNLLVALDGLDRVAELDRTVSLYPPTLAGSWGIVAAARRRAGRLQAALAAARQGQALDPDDLDVVNLFAVLLQETGETQEARRWFRWILDREPEHPQAKANLQDLGPR